MKKVIVKYSRNGKPKLLDIVAEKMGWGYMLLTTKREKRLGNMLSIWEKDKKLPTLKFKIDKKDGQGTSNKKVHRKQPK